MANRKSLKDELASRHLYDEIKGKNKEKEIVAGFLRRMSLDTCQVIDRERPDFTISYDEGALLVDCELTFLNHDTNDRGSPERRFHAQWKRFAKDLSGQLTQAGNQFQYLYGSIFFRNPDFRIFERLNAKMLIDEIVTVLKKHSGTGNISTFDQNTVPTLFKFVEHIYVKDCFPERALLWWCAHLQSGSVPDCGPTLVDIVKTKSEIAQSYEWKSESERWLLIYAAGTGLADIAVLSQKSRIDSVIGKSPFTSIFVWDKWSENIWIVYPKHAVILEDARTLHMGSIPTALQPYIR